MVDRKDDDVLEVPELSSLEEEIDLSDPGQEIKRIRAQIRQRIIGQNRAVDHITRLLTLSEAGLLREGELAGVAFLAGPPGVGKTELAYEVARAWIGFSGTDIFGEPIEPLTLIDCTKLKESHSVANLVGSVRGYVGYGDKAPFEQERLDSAHLHTLLKKKEFEEEVKDFSEFCLKLAQNKSSADESNKLYRARWKRLTAKVYERYGALKKVVLFDEIDLAHGNIHDLLMTIANGKPIELSNGEKANFENTLVLMSSNIGSHEIQRLLRESSGHGTGFSVGSANTATKPIDAQIYGAVSAFIKKSFSPPLVSRIRKNIVVFRPLSSEALALIVDRKLEDIAADFRSGGIEKRKGAQFPIALQFTPAFKEFILAEGIDPFYGVRPLEQVIRKYVREPIANGLSSQKISPFDRLCFDTKEENGKTRIVVKRVQ